MRRWPSAISEASDSEAETEIEEPPTKVARTSGSINVFHKEASAGQGLLPAAKGIAFDVHKDVDENAPLAPAAGGFDITDIRGTIRATLAAGPLSNTVKSRDPGVRPKTQAAASKAQGEKVKQANEA